MRRHHLYLLGLSVLLASGCENKQQEPAAHQEEPYTSSYAALDSMDAAPAPESTAVYEAPPAELAAPPPAAASSSDEVLAPVGGEVYVVQKGDTLYELARRFYKDQSRWRDIWEANKTRVPDPNKLRVGTKLIIP
jgi:5'-nucleotidase/UDP-sugar diphosphatase